MTQIAAASTARRRWLGEIDGLRAIAYVSIVFSHAVGALRYVDHSTGSMAVFGALLALTRFALPAFMMVSALLIARQVAAGEHPSTGRALRGLLVPYAAWSVTYLMLWKVVTGGPATNITQLFREIVRALLTGSAFDHLWYVLVAVQIALFAPVIARGLMRLRHVDRVLVLAIIVALNIALLGQLDGPVTKAAPWTHPFSGYSDRLVITWAAYVVGGIVVGLDYERMYAAFRERRAFIWAAYAVCSAALVVLAVRQATTTGGDYAAVIDVSSVRQPWIVPYQMLATVVCLDVSGMLMTGKARGALERLSRTSFGGYLVHPFWLLVANQYVLSRFIAPNGYIYVTALTAFALVCSYLTVLGLENARMPFGAVFLGRVRTRVATGEAIESSASTEQTPARDAADGAAASDLASTAVEPAKT